MEAKTTRVDWSKELVLELIKCWRENECLYNPKSKFYHNKHARYDALNSINENLILLNPLIGQQDIKNKLNYLRGQYTRELAKVNGTRSGAGSDDVYEPSAFWFDEMSFLQDFVKVRKGDSNFLSSTNDESSHIDYSPTPPKKRLKKVDEPQPCTSMEEDVLSAATKALNSISEKKEVGNNNDTAFANFIKSQLSEITVQSVKDELMETITTAIFSAKRKQNLIKENLEFQCEYLHE